jgi:peptidoglycan/LPS O-acetylase OafA/YrhL
MQTDSEKLLNIQALRGVAAFLVVVLHTLGTAADYGFSTRVFSPLRGWGFGGVDLFFVISGFVMVHVQRVKAYTPGRFLLNRVVRICPLYW